MTREIDSWSWAGFLMGGLWAIGNRVWIGLLCFVPIVNVIMPFVLGVKGRRWAWERTPNPEINRFILAQKYWVLSWFGFLCTAGLGSTAAVAVYGMQRYVMKAKVAEAMSVSRRLSQGITTCVASTGAVPPTSAPVPALLSSVSGRKYQSQRDEWKQPIFNCAGFYMVEPQVFQYLWLQTPTGGTVAAVGALRGGAVPDVIVTTQITCAGSACQAGLPVQLDGADAAAWLVTSALGL